ncbi:MAG: hypothetical protein AB1498_01890 [bacterium]
MIKRERRSGRERRSSKDRRRYRVDHSQNERRTRPFRRLLSERRRCKKVW